MRGSVSSQEIFPGCKAVLNIDAERAADLLYTFGQQVRVKEVKGDSMLVGFDGHNAREAWVNAGEVSITQATQPASKAGLRGGGGRNGQLSVLNPQCYLPYTHMMVTYIKFLSSNQTT